MVGTRSDQLGAEFVNKQSFRSDCSQQRCQRNLANVEHSEMLNTIFLNSIFKCRVKVVKKQRKYSEVQDEETQIHRQAKADVGTQPEDTCLSGNRTP